MSVVAVVEGHGEVESLPILIRRVCIERRLPVVHSLSHRSIFRIPRSKLVRAGEIEKAVAAAAIKLGGPGNILVLIDSDDDDPVSLENYLNGRAKAAAPHLNVEVVLAVREFESWIIHSISSLAGRKGLPENIMPPENPDAIRGAKEWISERMVGFSYSETVDCAAFTASMDLNLCMKSTSFSRFCEVVSRFT